MGDVKPTPKSVQKFNRDVFNQGIEWFDNGLKLEDAPDTVRNDTNFIRGFEKAQRVSASNEALYDYGVEYFNKGIPFEEIPIKYRHNESFLKGYKDAIKVSIKSDSIR